MSQINNTPTHSSNASSHPPQPPIQGTPPYHSMPLHDQVTKSAFDVLNGKSKDELINYLMHSEWTRGSYYKEGSKIGEQLQREIESHRSDILQAEKQLVDTAIIQNNQDMHISQ